MDPVDPAQTNPNGLIPSVDFSAIGRVTFLSATNTLQESGKGISFQLIPGFYSS